MGRFGCLGRHRRGDAADILPGSFSDDFICLVEKVHKKDVRHYGLGRGGKREGCLTSAGYFDPLCALKRVLLATGVPDFDTGALACPVLSDTRPADWSGSITYLVRRSISNALRGGVHGEGGRAIKRPKLGEGRLTSYVQITTGLAREGSANPS